jgi:DNA-binding SARP family transcriptional activator
MRKVQQRHRDDGEFIQLPGREQSVFEQRLRLSDGVEIAASVDAALRLFVQGWNTPALPVPVVLGVTFSTDILELTLGGDTESGHVPGPFTASADGHSVSVDRNVLARAIPQLADSRITTPPAPALVTAGHGSDGLIMVNLESLGTMTVAGDPAAREGVIRALALELATSLRKRWFDLIVVGFGSELERFDRVTSVPDPAAVVEGLYRRRASNAESLRSSRFESLAHARCHDDSDRWDPTVVICGPSVSREDTSELLALASDARLGIAVVAAGEGADLSPTVVLTGRYGDSSRNLLGSVILPQQITLSDLEGVSALMDNAVSRQSVPLSVEPYVNLSVPMPRSVPASVVGGAAAPWAHSSRRSFRRAESTRGMSRQGEDPRLWSGSTPEGDIGNPEVEVLVLGQIDVRGAARPFTRAWAQELVVYLAMHPRGATTEAWATALWPERIMAPSSLHSTASVARRSLGQAADGVDHLPRGHGRLTLSSTVGTDWDRFVMLAESEDPTRWRGALGLIRGRPFEGLRSSDWPILEGIAPAIEAAVVDLSGRLARSYLAAGDARGAEWAARQGLMVSPYDERLYRMLMRAADVAGNLAGVEAVMAELVHLVADDIEPLESVHPRTMDLYRSLTRGRHGAVRPL